jgi:L-seryl-tRNA(Ser) seleniumtransferase
MSIYSELGMRPVINATATLTKLGGSLMPPEVRAAMDEASRAFIQLDELQIKVGEKLAELTGNEAAYVATGAAAGLALTTAACMIGGAREKALLIPDREAMRAAGMKDEVLVFTSHRNGYDYSVRMTGAKIVDVGPQPSDLERAITERTAAFMWFQGGMTGRDDFALEKVIEICSARGVPVLVDAAAQVPPVENLRRFTELGATAAIFSGGKDLHGPQGTGLVVGKKWIVESMRAIGSPNQGFARAMKVSKENMVGLLAAVKRYVGLDHEAKRDRDERVVAQWSAAFAGLAGVRAERVFPNEAAQPLPRLLLHIDPSTGLTGEIVAARLLAGEPSIAVATAPDGIYLNPWLLTEEEVEVVARRVGEVIADSDSR